MNYRYHLARKWSPEKGRVVWVMLNPSTADAERDDATIRKCIGFTKRLGYGEMTVANLFAYRATKPPVLWRALFDGVDIVGPENDAQFHGIAANPVGSQLIICAWGAGRLLPAMLERVAQVESLLERHPLHCLGLTKGEDTRGNFPQPRHPLMLPYATPLQRFDAAPK